MSGLTPKQLVDAARAAEAAGNTESANRLKAAAQQAMAEQGAAKPGGPLQTAGDFAVGVGSGLQKGSRFGQEMLWRGVSALGGEDLGGDMLTNLNYRRAQTESANAERKARSPFAFGAGEFTGDLLFMAPIGGVGGAAARGAVTHGVKALTQRAVQQNTWRMGATGMAGEGAAVGAYSSGGENVLENASLGAATDLLFGTAINGVTKVGGEYTRRHLNTRRANAELEATTAPIAGRIDEAANFGGYQLDTATAASTRNSLQDYQDLKRSDVGQDIVDYEARREIDITDRARSLTGRFPGGLTPDSVAPYELVGSNMQRLTADLRQGDEGAYRALYNKFDELAAETQLTLDHTDLRARLDVVRDSNMNSASRGLLANLESDAVARGVAPPPPPPLASGVADPKRTANAAATAEPIPLTISGVESLIRDINDQFTQGMPAGHKRVLEQYKATLETFIDETLGSMDETLGDGASDLVGAARAARAARKAFSQDWEAKDIVNKISERSKGGEYAVDYNLALNNLTMADMNKLKSKIMLTPDGPQVIESMKQAPLLEALARATADTAEGVTEGGGIVFKHKAFRAAIDKIDRRTQEALWGPEFTEELHRTMDAWALRSRTPSRAGSPNPSGTAAELFRQLRFLPTGGTRNIGMAASGAFPTVRNALTKGTRQEAVGDILGGQILPKSTQDEMVAQTLDRFEQDFRGANGRQYGDMMRVMLRSGTVLQVTDDD